MSDAASFLFFREPRTQYFLRRVKTNQWKGPGPCSGRTISRRFRRKAGESQLTKHAGSMAQDIEAGRETEFEAMTGYVVRKAKELGVPVPVTESVYRGAKGVEYAANARRAKPYAGAQSLFDARSATQQAVSLFCLAADDRNVRRQVFFFFLRLRRRFPKNSSTTGKAGQRISLCIEM